MAGALSLEKGQRSFVQLNKSRSELSGGRCAGSAMQGKRIARSRVRRERKIPSNEFGYVDEVERGRSQRRHVQRLADVASRPGTTGVVVEDCPARGKVEHRRARQQCQRATRKLPPKNVSLPFHRTSI